MISSHILLRAQLAYEYETIQAHGDFALHLLPGHSHSILIPNYDRAMTAVGYCLNHHLRDGILLRPRQRCKELCRRSQQHDEENP